MIKINIYSLLQDLITFLLIFTQEFVNKVIETIELDEVRDCLVGIPGVNGLSTEQRKRLTIAVELVGNPSIIFMDKPISGLDARAAAIVMRAVKNVVEMGRTVVCTIHQLSIDIFEAFDEVIVIVYTFYFTKKQRVNSDFSLYDTLFFQKLHMWKTKPREKSFCFSLLAVDFDENRGTYYLFWATGAELQESC